MTIHVDETAFIATIRRSDGTAWPERGMVPHNVVQRACLLVDSSGLVDDLARWRTEDQDRTGTGRGGRPPTVGDRSLLALLVVLTIENAPLLLTRMAEIVTNRLEPTSRDLLGLPDDAASFQSTYHRLRRRLHAILDVIDPFPIPTEMGGSRRHRLTKDAFQSIKEQRDPAEQTRRRKRLHHFTNRLIETTARAIPRRIRRRWKGNTCIDATHVRAFGKSGRPPRSEQHSIEPDAGWWKRDGDHRGNPADGRTGIADVRWGWEAHIVVMAQNTDGNRDFPLLALGMSFDKPGKRISENAVSIYRTIRDNGHPSGIAASDMLYFPMQKPEKYHLPMRALGHGLIGKYPQDTFGKNDYAHGALLVDGWWHCPATPDALRHLDQKLSEDGIDRNTWHQRIERRRQYAFKAVARPDEHGGQRLMCPAEAGTIACPLKPHSHQPGLTRIDSPPDPPDKVCTQRTVTFDITAGAKYRQDLRYGSPEWESLLDSARNTIEGFNALLKNGDRHALDDSSRRRVRGRTAAAVFTALLIAAVNLQKVADYLEQTSGEHGSTPIRRPRRRTVSVIDYLPDGQPARASPAA